MSSGKKLLIVVAAALIDPQGRVLLAQRPAGKSFAGLWEFPGGKIEPGEGLAQALGRELEEELAIMVEPDAMDPFAFASHEYEDFHLLMPLYLIRQWRGEPKPLAAQALTWAYSSELDRYQTPPADAPLIKALKERL